MARVRTKSCQHSDLSKPGQRQTNRCHHVTKRQIEKKSTLKERKKNLESKLRIHGGWSFLLALAITAFVIALYIGKILLLRQQKHASNIIHLIQPLYIPTNTKRRLEIEFATKRNKALFKQYTQLNSLQLSDLFRACKTHAINIIANADVYFDTTINRALVLPLDHAYALSRYEMMNGQLFNRPDSQDVWIVHGRPWNNLTAELNNNDHLALGKPGIDNRLAYELLKAGYQVSNPSKSILSWHVHSTNIRQYSHLDVVPPPYAIVYPMTLEEVLAEDNLVKKKTEIFPHGFSLEQVRKMSAYNQDEDD